jgi:hypothetical protein
MRWRFFDSWRASSGPSLYVASWIVLGFINRITYRRPRNEARRVRHIVAQRDNSAGMRDAFLLEKPRPGRHKVSSRLSAAPDGAPLHGLHLYPRLFFAVGHTTSALTGLGARRIRPVFYERGHLAHGAEAASMRTSQSDFCAGCRTLAEVNTCLFTCLLKSLRHF